MFESVLNYFQSWAQILPVFLLPAIGGLISERSGIANLALEGKILIGAFGAIIGTAQTGNIWGGILFSIMFGISIALLHAFLCINVKINEFVSGIIINQFAIGLTGSAVSLYFKNQRPTVDYTVPSIVLLDRISISPIFIFALIILFFSTYCMEYTFIKSWITACGDSTLCAQRSGLPVNKIRYTAVIISGALCGIAGAHLSIGIMNQFSRGISSGYGFLAIGAIILGSWKPLPTFFACSVMAAVEIAQFELQVFPDIPYQIGYLVSYAVIFGVMIIRKGAMSPPEEIGK